MPLRSLVLGSKLKAAVTAFFVLTASVGGGFALGILGAPTVAAVDNSFGPVSNDTTVVETDLVINNPYPINVRLGDTTIDYTVAMNDVEMAGGEKEGVAVGPGNTTLNFTTDMRNERIPPWWASHVRNGEVTNVTVDANVETGLLGDRTFEIQQKQQVETDIIGQFNSNETRPVEGPSNPLYSNPVLYINETRAEWGDVSDAKTPIDMQFTVYNPQLQPYTVTEVGYEITMNGVPVGQGATDQPYLIEQRSTEEIRTTPTIDNDRLDDWWVTHLRNDQVTELRIDFYAKAELPTGHEIRIPLNRLAYEKTIETDIFGNKENGTATPNGTSSTATSTPTPGNPSPDATPTDGSPGSDAATPTETPTESDGLFG